MGQNIAYDLALVKLGPHTKFGKDWSNSADFYSGHTHKHTHTDSTLYIRYKNSIVFWASVDAKPIPNVLVNVMI